MCEIFLWGCPPWIYGVKSSLVFWPFLTVSEPLSFRNTEQRINSYKCDTIFFALVIYDNAAKKKRPRKYYLGVPIILVI